MLTNKVLLILVVLLAGVLWARLGEKILKKVLPPLREFHLTYKDQRYIPFMDHTSIKIFVASSLDRVFQDGKTLVEPRFSSSASISAAANEYESFQVIVQ
ncbi:MAG: hypothetical protein HQL13_06020, partial [Candidatus Omnitrophica bacterium]|nr:hypothetical protein [Candidatus Omnitrophota bacterium]